MQIKKWSELKNVDKEHAEILSRLNGLRRLKYKCPTNPVKEDSRMFLKTVRKMIEEAEKLIKD